MPPTPDYWWEKYRALAGAVFALVIFGPLIRSFPYLPGKTDPTVLWTALGAVGQWVGAIGTTAAVIVALGASNREREAMHNGVRPRLEIHKLTRSIVHNQVVVEVRNNGRGTAFSLDFDIAPDHDNPLALLFSPINQRGIDLKAGDCQILHLDWTGSLPDNGKAILTLGCFDLYHGIYHVTYPVEVVSGIPSPARERRGELRSLSNRA